MADIETVLEQCTPGLLELPDVLGVGQGEADGATVIVVLVKKLTRQLRRDLPVRIAAFPVQVREVGNIDAAAG